MRLIRTTIRRLRIAGDLTSFLMAKKRWWMLPMISVLLLLAVLMVLAQTAAIAPFIYTLF